jgi:hypothetical protein
LGITLALLVALGLVGFGVFEASRRSAASSQRQPVSMADAAQAMRRAGETMRTHGQAMIGEAHRTGDQEQAAHGEQWLRDGQALLRGAGWMAMDPTDAGSLASSPAELARQGSWGPLIRGAQAMLHDPRGAREVDVEALRWNGLAMRAEGQTMAEHGRLMAEEVATMIVRDDATGEPLAEPRAAASALQSIGDRLQLNGQAMVEEADHLRRVLALS